jgi:5'-3' exonuclease
MDTTAIIDADMLLYQVVLAAQVETIFDDEIVGPFLPLKVAMQLYDSRVAGILKYTGCNQVLMALSDPTASFRRDIEPSYKQGRTKKKPHGYRALESMVQAQYPWKILPGCEGDDVMGIYAGLYGKKCVLVSDDKDLKTIPGTLAKLKPKPDEGLLLVSPLEANRFLFLQALMGDRVDGYSGCPGMGIVKATKLIEEAIGNDRINWTRQTFDNLVSAYLAAFAKAGLTPEQAFTQIRMARILRKSDYNLTTNKHKSWDITSYHNF